MIDPYVDENGVLKNKLNITNDEELNRAEADIGFIQLISIDSVEIDNCPPKEIFKRLHKHIFKDIFDWAGEYRTCPLIKEEFIFPSYTVPYSSSRCIPKDLQSHIFNLELIDWSSMSQREIANVFARKMALLWKVHPFRDGNTRTTMSYACRFAKDHGFPMDMKTFTDNLMRVYGEDGRVIRHSIRDKFVIASLDEKDLPEVRPLAAVFEKAMNNYRNTPARQYHK